MENAIIIGVVVLIVGAISFYLIRAKRRGQTCIGCPYSKACQSHGKCTCQSHGDHSCGDTHSQG